MSKAQHFRKAFRQYRQARQYRGDVHLGLLSLASLTVAVLCGVAIDPSHWDVRWHGVAIPASFVLTSLIEYVGHRWPMHRPTSFGKAIYRRHAAIHHRYFTVDCMGIDSKDDLREVLTPVRQILGFLVFGYGPVLVLLALLDWNLGMVFGVAGAVHYMVYEWVHLSTHLPDAHPVTRWPVLRYLRAHHQAHHDTRVMRHGNFNITFPLWDWLLGTFAKDRFRSKAQI